MSQTSTEPTKAEADLLVNERKEIAQPKIRPDANSRLPQVDKLHGPKWVVALLMLLVFGLFLSLIESSITATALVTIGKYFNNPIKTTWIVLAYLISYMGFSLIFARISDGIGRRTTLIIAWLLFGLFSLATGLARTLDQAIGFRVLQGIGGSGLYTMAFVFGIQITPSNLFGLFSGILGMTIAIGAVIGPVLGGVITQKSSWRWIYLYNSPCAVASVIACLLVLPGEKKGSGQSHFSLARFKRVDFLGALLLLIASTLLVFALQEAGRAEYSWRSGAIIASLTISGLSWVALFAWISYVEYRTDRKAILPAKLLFSRPTGPAILLIILAGFPFYIAIVNLPQRFQIVNGSSPIMAGIRLVPLLGSAAVGSTLGGMISSKQNRTAETVIAASCFIIIGCGLLSTVSGGHSIDKAIYGYEVIIGFGNGLTFSSTTMMVSLASGPEDNAAGQGAVSQARMLGGTIGLAIATVVFGDKLNRTLAGSLAPAQLIALRQSLSTILDLTPEQQHAVVKVYADSFNAQMRVCTYVTAFGVLAALATWQRNPVSIEEVRERQKAAMVQAAMAQAQQNASDGV